MRVLLVDNYDSFTYNLFQLLGEVNGEQPIVVRNDELHLGRARRADEFDNIVISPGPGRPDRERDFGVCAGVLRDSRGAGARRLPRPPGRSATLSAAQVVHAPEVDARPHRAASTTTGDDLFAGIPQAFDGRALPLAGRRRAAGRARVTAWTEDGV